MADPIKSEYYRFNGVSWDIHYFKTTMDMVVGLTSALNGKSSLINLTGQLQVASYRRSVIALCNLTNTNPSANSYSIGTLTFHRTNGLSSAVKYDFAIEKRYNTAGFNLSQTVLAGSGFVNGIRPCTFVKNGIKYGGIEVFFSDAELYYIEFQGTTNFGIFGLDYYVTNTSSPLDNEVNGSLVFEDATNIRIADTFKVGEQLVVLNNDARLTNARPASDVYAWAKAANKPSYTWSEIGSKPSWIGASKPDYVWTEIGSKPTFATVATSGSYNDLSDKPTIPTVPSVMTTTEGNTGTATTQRTINAANLKTIILNHSPAGSRPASDVASWAKAASKPSYAWSEITSKPSVIIDGDARLTDARPASDVSSWAKAASKPSYAWSEIGSKPSFATVATSGSYDDLTNKPSIPTVPSVMTTTEGNTGTATTQRTINAANLKAIILNHSPAGARPASDVSAWAKADNKPIYGWSDIISKPSWIGSSKPSYSWSEIDSKPSWIGASKPSYSWSEIDSKPLVVVNTSPHPTSDMLIEKDFITLKSAVDTFGLSDEGVPYLRCGLNSDGMFEIYGSIYATGDIFANSRRVQKMSTPFNISATATLNSSHLDTMIVCKNSTAMVLYIPTEADLGYPPLGTEIHFFQHGTGNTTISYTYGVTLRAKDNKRVIDGQYAAATAKLIGTNEWMIVGALKS